MAESIAAETAFWRAMTAPRLAVAERAAAMAAESDVMPVRPYLTAALMLAAAVRGARIAADTDDTHAPSAMTAT